MEPQEFDLAVRVLNGDAAARDEMIRMHYGLIVEVAKYYQRAGSDFSDLRQDGVIGLIHAVETFDPYLGFEFSTYADFWIRSTIRYAVMGGGEKIKVPAVALVMLSKWDKMQRQLGSEATTQEIAHALGLTDRMARNVLRTKKAVNITRVDQESRMRSLVCDKMRPAEELVENAELFTSVMQKLSKLHKRDRIVIAMRYGLCGYQPSSLRETGLAIGTTPEGVRKIEARVLAKLRS